MQNHLLPKFAGNLDLIHNFANSCCCYRTLVHNSKDNAGRQTSKARQAKTCVMYPKSVVNLARVTMKIPGH